MRSSRQLLSQQMASNTIREIEKIMAKLKAITQICFGGRLLLDVVHIRVLHWLTLLLVVEFPKLADDAEARLVLEKRSEFFLITLVERQFVY